VSDEGRAPRRRRRSSQQDAALVDAIVAPQYGARFAQGLLDALPTGERLQVLDVGCRTGQISFRLLQRLGPTSRVIAIDPDPGLIGLARQRGYGETGRRLFFKEECVEKLSFGEGVFDAVVAHLVYRDLEQRPAALREMHRVLAPGGRLLLTTPLRGSYVEVFDMLRERARAEGDDVLAARVRSLVERDPAPTPLVQALEAAGFIAVNLERIDFRLSFASADALFSDRLLGAIAFPEWQATVGPEALDDVRRRLATYFDQGALSLTVAAAQVSALRAPE